MQVPPLCAFNLLTIHEPHVIGIIDVRGFECKNLEIWMPLFHGNISALISDGFFEKDPAQATQLLFQMLQALDYLESIGIANRDIKPANILYKIDETGTYTFCLADFGLSSLSSKAQSFAGTPLYMAPEAYNAGHNPGKSDVWSLCVTFAEAINIGGFREKLRAPGCNVRELMKATVRLPSFADYKAMGLIRADKRASAAEMLVRLFDGKGRAQTR